MINTSREALTMKPAKTRYSIVQGFTCPRCSASDGAACETGGKARRTPHKERITKAYSSPSAHRAMGSGAAIVAAPYTPRKARKSPPHAERHGNDVHGLWNSIAEAFSAR